MTEYSSFYISGPVLSDRSLQMEGNTNRLLGLGAGEKIQTFSNRPLNTGRPLDTVQLNTGSVLVEPTSTEVALQIIEAAGFVSLSKGALQGPDLKIRIKSLSNTTWLKRVEALAHATSPIFLMCTTVIFPHSFLLHRCYKSEHLFFLR